MQTYPFESVCNREVCNSKSFAFAFANISLKQMLQESLICESEVFTLAKKLQTQIAAWITFANAKMNRLIISDVSRILGTPLVGVCAYVPIPTPRLYAGR